MPSKRIASLLPLPSAWTGLNKATLGLVYEEIAHQSFLLKVSLLWEKTLPHLLIAVPALATWSCFLNCFTWW